MKQLSFSTLAIIATTFASLSPIHTQAYTQAHTQAVQLNQSINLQKQATNFLKNYSVLAQKSYQASLNDAKILQQALERFAKYPTQQNLNAAKEAWLQARESYGLTEVFRLSQGPIDAEEGWVAEIYGNLEGQINAWPLDEHMIDYTIDADGNRTQGNIIDATGLFTPIGENAQAVDITDITPEVLTELNENGGECCNRLPCH